MRTIPSKTLFLIGFLVTITIALLGVALFMAANQNKKALTTTTSQTIPTPKIPKTALVSFSPASLVIPAGSSSSATVDIIVTTGENPITGAQIEVDYDPTVVSNIRYIPPDITSSLLGQPGTYLTLFTDNKTPGKIVFANAINPDSTAVSGTGSVGKLSFSLLRTKPSTALILGPETKITTNTTRESILKSTTPLTITFQ